VNAGQPYGEIAQVEVDDRTGKVNHAWTGPQVAWGMARGYKGWFGRKPTGTVRDVVINRYDEGSEIFVSPNETVASAFARMRAADVSQLPVIEGDGVVGLVEESDLLDALVAAGETMAEVFRMPVGEVMVSRLETVSADAPVRDLLPLFRRGLVPLVMDGAKFLGLVTRIDLINHFRVRDR